MVKREAFCPHCRSMTTIDSAGRCMHTDCDRIVLGGKRVTVKYPGAGAKLITVRVLREAYDLYLTGLSLRRVAEEVWPRTKYASARCCANQLHDQFRCQGWPLRDRIAATVAASYKHGLAPRDPAKRSKGLRSMQRRARGDVQGIQCAGIKTRYGKGRGERCQLAAMRGSEFCRQHDPALAEVRALELAALRARRDVG